jgi:prolyl-tRNA synthetase
MRFSQLFCPTLKEDPTEADVISHKLMLRSGMIRQLASGVYNLLPVGLKSIRKVERVVREEMNLAGALEVYLPAVQPAELWKESGRWELLGKELLRFKDRNDRDFCFGPTHEEVITDLVRREIKSYRELPKNFYQIQIKFRDEVRPRFGLMRGREFEMKDAYSFDADDAGATKSYEAMRETYKRIFSRCGLDYAVVEADSGNIGGSLSQEFMVMANSGEDEIIRCAKCDYAANVEKAVGKIQDPPKADLPIQPERMPTPGKKSVTDQAAVMKVPVSAIVKMLVYKTDSQFVAVLLPGDRELNETKLKSHLGALHLGLASAAEVLKLVGAPVGFCGPKGLKLQKDGIARLLTDELIREGGAYVVGANEPDTHIAGVIAGKDFDLGERVNLHRTRAGDLCARCGGTLRSDRGIEVGHIFKLGTKYSKSMKAQFADRDGSQRDFIMGCYGIGIGRTLAAAIEQNHDDRGICLPWALAPFEVAIVPIDVKNEALRSHAERLYEELKKEGFDVLIDDRDAPPGRRFKDLELMGIPARITIGEKSLAQGKIEVQSRREMKGNLIDPTAVRGWLSEVRG